jgi:hypothetical protein
LWLPEVGQARGLPPLAQDLRNGHLDTSILETEESTKKELDRIQKLEPSKSPVLNERALTDALDAISAYSDFAERTPSLEQAQVESARKQALEAFDQLLAALPSCQGQSLNKSLITITHQWNQMERLGSRQVSRFSADDVTTIQEIENFLYSDADKICQQYKNEKNHEMAHLRSQMSKAFDIVAKQLQAQIDELKQKAPRAQRLLEAWMKYKEKVQKALEDQTPSAIKVADQLWIIIGVFCLFWILMFLTVRAFSEEVQMELIASGQVIQFATVMVLLIVVCVLGMSKFLADNTLGTLLGGIGGYVLSQGVGRAVRREAVREAQSQQQPPPPSPSPPPLPPPNGPTS